MQVRAILKYARISPLKCRIVTQKIKGLPVEKALQILTYSPRKSSAIIKKVLNSAIANAEHNEGIDIDELKISSIFIDEGPTAKRIRARAKGRATRILKRASHITVAVTDK